MQTNDSRGRPVIAPGRDRPFATPLRSTGDRRRPVDDRTTTCARPGPANPRRDDDGDLRDRPSVHPAVHCPGAGRARFSAVLDRVTARTVPVMRSTACSRSCRAVPLRGVRYPHRQSATARRDRTPVGARRPRTVGPETVAHRRHRRSAPPLVRPAVGGGTASERSFRRREQSQPRTRPQRPDRPGGMPTRHTTTAPGGGSAVRHHRDIGEGLRDVPRGTADAFHHPIEQMPSAALPVPCEHGAPVPRETTGVAPRGSSGGARFRRARLNSRIHVSRETAAQPPTIRRVGAGPTLFVPAGADGRRLASNDAARPRDKRGRGLRSNPTDHRRRSHRGVRARSRGSFGGAQRIARLNTHRVHCRSSPPHRTHVPSPVRGAVPSRSASPPDNPSSERRPTPAPRPRAATAPDRLARLPRSSLSARVDPSAADTAPPSATGPTGQLRNFRIDSPQAAPGPSGNRPGSVPQEPPRRLLAR